jgi:hypothetical protein
MVISAVSLFIAWSWYFTITMNTAMSNPESLTQRQQVIPINPRIALFLVYQMPKPGKLPIFMNYVAESCGWQQATADCYFEIIVSDEYFAKEIHTSERFNMFPCRSAKNDELPKNVFVNIRSFSQWKQFLYERTDHQIIAQSLSNYKKQVDYKILYGTLFEDVLLSSSAPEGNETPQQEESKEQRQEPQQNTQHQQHHQYQRKMKYSHFGWMDPDVLLGNLTSFMSPWQWEIYTSYYEGGYQEGTVAGQLTVFQNNYFFRHLWNHLPEIVPKLNAVKEYGSDERGMGKFLFNYHKNFRSSSKLKIQSGKETFLDYFFNNTGELYFEKGRLLRRNVCYPKSKIAPEREAVVLHLHKMKKCFEKRINSCEKVMELSKSSINSHGGEGKERLSPWKLPRWNISAGLECSFNDDPKWSTIPSKDIHCYPEELVRRVFPKDESFLDRVFHAFGYY